ncbi:MAG TPA: phosphate signaling complex protein PhoU [Candidatus Faecaligallichristensenella faecipullorum]|nr:phosphate signaling complex protein PhoU [Candidatus Faecaligallichristensenella faecipullorum]
MRNRFDRELDSLNNELIEMGALVENAIENATQALINRDGERARAAIQYDMPVDEKEKDIERRCLRLLLQQQPVATDLRLISTALKMITDMERIGDQAADISEITLRLLNEQDLKHLEHIQQMAQATIRMVRESIDAFVNRDLALAQAVEAYDDVVDDLFTHVKNDLIDLIRADANYGEQAVDLLMIAKYFERIGDHATNIAEWVEFSLTGKHKNERIL